MPFRTKHQFYEKTRQTEDVLRSFISQVAATVPIENTAALPKYQNVVRQIERKWVVQEHNSKTLASCYRPSCRAPTKSPGDNLIAHDSWLANEEENRKNLDLLETCTHWQADWTFMCCPPLFYQFSALKAFQIITRCRLSLVVSRAWPKQLMHVLQLNWKI